MNMPRRYQFTIAQILFVTFVVACELGFNRWIYTSEWVEPLGAVAGVLSLAFLAVFAVVAVASELFQAVFSSREEKH